MTRALRVTCAIGLLFWSNLAYSKTVGESAREIPVAAEVDVVVVGGTVAGVAAAVEAARQEANV